MSMTDAELLRCYTNDGSEAAFTELVERHLSLVYSVARRHVRSAALAEEVAQSVFIEFARAARRIETGAPLVAWFHVVARRVAINAVRAEARRQLRETEAADLALMTPNSSTWADIAPLLDAAVEALRPDERAAILLRFFENKNLREVGSALGVSDDAAQKRVTRALDQLRATFARRGVVLTASGLASDLSAHVIQTLPAGLSGAICAKTIALGSALPASGVVHGKNWLATAMVRKAWPALAAATAVGIALYHTGQIFAQGAQLRTAREETRRLTDEFDGLQRAQRAARRITFNSPGVRPAVPPDALELEMQAWLARVEELKSILRSMPQESTPEIALLTPEAWLQAVKEVDLNDPQELLKTFRQLRHIAKNYFALDLMGALRDRLAANEGMLPTDLDQLEPFFKSPIDEDILQRYELTASGRFDEKVAGGYVVAEKLPVRSDDRRVVIGPRGYSDEDELMQAAMTRAAAEFAAAHNGKPPSKAEEFQSYLSPADAAKFPAFMMRLIRDQREHTPRSPGFRQ